MVNNLTLLSNGSRIFWKIWHKFEWVTLWTRYKFKLFVNHQSCAPCIASKETHFQYVSVTESCPRSTALGVEQQGKFQRCTYNLNSFLAHWECRYIWFSMLLASQDEWQFPHGWTSVKNSIYTWPAGCLPTRNACGIWNMVMWSWCLHLLCHRSASWISQFIIITSNNRKTGVNVAALVTRF